MEKGKEKRKKKEREEHVIGRKRQREEEGEEESRKKKKVDGSKYSKIRKTDCFSVCAIFLSSVPERE